MTQENDIMNIQKITVVGAGQIGTSLVMAIRGRYPGAEIVALDTNKNLEEKFVEALGKAGIDSKSITLAYNDASQEITGSKQVAGSNLVILATPISQFGNAVRTIAPYLSENTFITDVGSVKELSIERIRSAIDEACPRLSDRYVPAHILNGNAGSGPLTASPKKPEEKTLFEGQPLILVPDVGNEKAYDFVKGFWQSLSTRIFEMPAGQHDRIVGTTSHFHYASMFALMLTDEIENGSGPDIGGWIHGPKGMTRVANAETEMWRAIFEDNRDNILKSAECFKSILSETMKVIETDNAKALPDIISSAHAYAKDVRGDRGGKPVDPSEYLGRTDLINSAFASLISMAVARNVQRVEQETGQPFAPIANPSAKDGMGPIGIDPKAVLYLLKEYGPQLKKRTKTYIEKLDVLITAIKENDNATICRFIDEARQTRQVILQRPTFPQALFQPEGASLRCG